MRPKVNLLIERCIEDGINYGWNRAHKHVDSPSEYEIKDQIQSAIMNELYEWFDMFPEDKNE